MRRLFPLVLRLAPLLLPGLLMAACDILGPSGPEGPGYFDMELYSFRNLEGAAAFRLEGGGELGEVTSEVGEVFYEHHGGTSDVVVIMDEPGTIGFRVATENLGKKPDVTVVQVAGPDDILRPSLSGYFVSVRRVKIATGGGQ